MTMRNFINLTEAFWHRPEPTQRPADAETRFGFQGDPIAYAKRFPSAEEYADAMNPISVMNTDPPSMHQRYQATHDRLINQWNNWKLRGMLGEAAPTPQRIAEAIRDHGFDHRHDREIVKALVQMYRRGFADRA